MPSCGVGPQAQTVAQAEVRRQDEDQILRREEVL